MRYHRSILKYQKYYLNINIFCLTFYSYSFGYNPSLGKKNIKNYEIQNLISPKYSLKHRSNILHKIYLHLNNNPGLLNSDL